LLKWLRNAIWGKPRPAPGVAHHSRSAEYDAARTNEDNRRHWARTDNLSARSANSLEVRKTIRERARYESANNSYCRGITLTRANDLIGTGARLQVLGQDSEQNRQVERAFTAWAAAVDLAGKLRTASQAKIVDGEAFAVLASNDQLANPVQLDVQLVECDRVTDPRMTQFDPWLVDGIRYDRAGNPIEYTILDEHPGDGYRFTLDSTTLPARYVLHWFRQDRPGQVRGVSELTPALALFAQLRRFTLATLTAAETAADFAALLETQAPPDGDTEDPNPFETLEIERGMMTTLPGGAKLAQLKAEHPATTYEMFKREVLNEIGRCLNMPFNKTAGNSSSYNYASGRLDHQTYFRDLDVERSHCERVLLHRIYRAWLDEAVMIPGLIPDGFDMATPVDWYWDGWEHVDPVKEASADEIGLATNTTTLAELYARRGLDWEDALRQRAREMELMRELGLTPAPAPGGGVDARAQEKEQAYRG